MEKRSYTKLYTKLCVTKMPQMVFIIWPSHQHNNGRRSRIRNVKVATVNSILIKLYILYIFPVEKKVPPVLGGTTCQVLKVYIQRRPHQYILCALFPFFLLVKNESPSHVVCQHSAGFQKQVSALDMSKRQCC